MKDTARSATHGPKDGPEAGDLAPDFEAPASGGGSLLRLSSLRGRKVVLYFYPRDDTPGCTREACGFRDAMARLGACGAEVVGVSKDSLRRHDSFRAKHGLPFPLLCDDGAICEAYGVWVEKKNYGRRYMGIKRATFLIDGAGVVCRVWRKVRVAGHVEEVVAAAEALAPG